MDEHNIPQAPTQISPLCDEKNLHSIPSFITPPFSGEDSFEISYPNNGDVFVIDPVLRREYQTILLKQRLPMNRYVEWFGRWKLFQTSILLLRALDSDSR